MTYPPVTPHGQPATLADHELSIMLACLKGGVGKSTSAWMILIELARRGYRALGVDADPVSQTLADSYRRANARGHQVPFSVISWPSAEGFTAGVSAALAEQRTLATGEGRRLALIVDTGGDNTETFREAGLLCQELIVPVAPSEQDLRRLPATLDAAKMIAVVSPLAFSVLLVKTQAAAADAREARIYLEQKDWPLMEAQVPDQVLYKRSFGNLPADTGAYAEVVDELLAARTQTEEAAA